MNINSILAYYQNINLKHEWEFQFCLGYKQLQRMMLSPKQWKNNELVKKKKKKKKIIIIFELHQSWGCKAVPKNEIPKRDKPIQWERGQTFWQSMGERSGYHATMQEIKIKSEKPSWGSVSV